MKLKKIVTLWLSLVLFTANITSQYKAFADNEVGNEVKNETAKEAKQKSKENELDLVMAGDVLLHTRLAYWSEDGKGGYDFNPIFKLIKPIIKKADLAIVNQETILGGKELGVSGYPTFNGPYELGDAIANAGFDVVLQSNNHSLDRGKQGIYNCLNFWKKYPKIKTVGINTSEAQKKKLCIYKKNGIKVAILNYTYGTNGIPLPKDMPYAVNYLVKDEVINDIKRAEKEADFTIVCPHWGTEYFRGISDYQKIWSKIFVENGVDLVLGAHPHVIEPIKYVTDKKTGHKMLVYYSLGNFVNSTMSDGRVGDRYVGGLAKVKLKRGTDNKVRIAKYGVKATVMHNGGTRFGSSIYPLTQYTEELAKKNVMKTQDYMFSLNFCKKVCNEVWGKLWD
ncbi:CapA family protein [Catonella massiliensis]|uniref:CapA family protein n=1 Tax=Catonella massiliensis TaxID=2799636 RepID=A0ABS1IYK6_9FIRM|nr:CapA family protein [Catonella massiliensis]MBK5896976.1 CapA family protein [Catonella massiliensis]